MGFLNLFESSYFLRNPLHLIRTWCIKRQMPEQDSTLQTFLAAAHDFADEARDVIRELAGTSFLVSSKTDKSLVSEADIKIEKRLRERIGRLFPEHGVIGEELGDSNPEASYQWILDPIDGTEEYVNGLPTFGCIISLELNGEPLLGLIDHPALNVRVFGAKGSGTFCNDKRIILSEDITSDEQIRLGISKKINFSRCGDETDIFEGLTSHYPNLRVFDSCFAYTSAVTGGLDVMVDYNVRHWDISACKLLCEEAGGAFKWIHKRKIADGKVLVSAIFGKKESVRRIASHFSL